tara:strand:+ start:17477 stop:17617 length:141 start_codon:yes stop_codon:yes gene_type:complete
MLPFDDSEESNLEPEPTLTMVRGLAFLKWTSRFTMALTALIGPPPR